MLSRIEHLLSARVSLLAVFGSVILGMLSAGVAALEKHEENSNDDKKVAAGINVRFSTETDEIPDFQKHISPLLGRLGCNGRACHGSFQGQGGFRLSLFGYDFKTDCAALLADGTGRVDCDEPAESLVLLKGSAEIDHEGGQRFSADGWEAKVVEAWIAAGAPAVSTPSNMKSLEVTPHEIRFDSEGQRVPLQVVVHWADGSSEDVTSLARFQSNDPSIAEVDSSGIVTGVASGDSHIVVFYDNGVSPVFVFKPYTLAAGTEEATYTSIFANPIDQLVQVKLDKLNLPRSDYVDDATFLRRVSLDIAGSLPSANDVREFLNDTSATKRADKIEELLETPAYVAWWTTFLCDMTGNNSQELRNVGSDNASQQWYDWIHQRVADNVPYDQIIEGIVLSSSRVKDESYREYCERMSKMAHDKTSDTFVSQDSMPYYWMRRETQDRETRAIAFAQNFLGVQIQCAQCHKHPFDRWSQQDFEEFSRFFSGVATTQYNNVPELDKPDAKKILLDLGIEPGTRVAGGNLQKISKDAIRDGKTIPYSQLSVTRPKLTSAERKAFVEALAAASASQEEIAVEPKGNAKKKLKKQKPEARGPLYHADARILGEAAVPLKDIADVREPVMEWMRAKNNPFFARAFVNRVWAKYFGIGIVNPIDDLNRANAPSNEPLLDYLAKGFIDSGFDMKWLHRQIANSRTYQTSWQPVAENAYDQRNFSHALPRRLPAELVIDSIIQACSPDERNEAFLETMQSRSIAIAGTNLGATEIGGRKSGFALVAFGRSDRNNNCDCDRSNDTSLIQTVYLQNDQDIHNWLTHPQGWVAQATNSSSSNNANLNNELNAINERLRRLQQAVDSSKNPDRADAAEKKIADLRKRKQWLLRQIEAVNKIAAQTNELEQLVENAYLRSLSRYPTPEEIASCIDFIDRSKSRNEGLVGVLWTLINTKEFIVNH